MRTAGTIEVRESAARSPDRGPRRDRACYARADKFDLSRDPQADRIVFLCRPQARQGARRDVAAIRTAVPQIFNQRDHARTVGGAGAGRELGQSAGPHLLALAI